MDETRPFIPPPPEPLSADNLRRIRHRAMFTAARDYLTELDKVPSLTRWDLALQAVSIATAFPPGYDVDAVPDAPSGAGPDKAAWVAGLFHAAASADRDYRRPLAGLSCVLSALDRIAGRQTFPLQ